MTTINLDELQQLQEIHRRLASGYHISEQDLPLWQSLTTQQAAFEALFTALGYSWWPMCAGSSISLAATTPPTWAKPRAASPLPSTP